MIIFNLLEWIVKITQGYQQVHKIQQLSTHFTQQVNEAVSQIYASRQLFLTQPYYRAFSNLPELAGGSQNVTKCFIDCWNGIFTYRGRHFAFSRRV